LRLTRATSVSQLPFFFSLLPPPPRPPLFPYTTLFRSRSAPPGASPQARSARSSGATWPTSSRPTPNTRRPPSGRSRWSCFARSRSEEHTSELQSLTNLVCRLLLEKKKQTTNIETHTPH